MIQTRNLTRRFGAVEAIEDLTLTVPESSVFALIGPNGAGKTTTIKTLMNILRPTSGRAEVLGIDSRNSARRSSRGSATFPKTRACPTGCRWATSCRTAARSTRRGTTTSCTRWFDSTDCRSIASSGRCRAGCA